MEVNVLLGLILGQIEEILLAALTLHASAVLEQTTSFRHAGANNALLHRLVRGELPLSHLHHLIDRHVLLEL